jgi:hypothetical protein
MKPSKLTLQATIRLSAFLAMTFLAAFSLRAQTLPCPDTNIIKFVLLPQLDGGLDVRDTGADNIVLADDFFCNTPGPITDIHLWGSWLSDVHGTITNFWLGIYSDVPAVTNFSTGIVTPSHPGTNLLWQQSFGIGQFSENTYSNGSEQFFDPPSASNVGFDGTAWYYCFYPTTPFMQQGTAQNPTNYWLAVYALEGSAGGAQGTYGWKTSQSNYNDAAVWGHFVATSGNPIGDWKSMTNTQNQPINLSFKLNTTNTQPPVCNERNGVKYIQPPNFQGLDVWNSGPWVLADDFVCTNTGPVSDIHLWGSWAKDQQPDPNISFWLAVYDDVPVSPTNNFSHPGNLLWNQQFPPGQYVQSFWGTGSEAFLDPGPPNIIGPESNIWYYCFTPTNLTQYGSLANPSNYWLMVYATLPSGSTNMYGWKTTTAISNDISVHVPWPGSPPIGNPGWMRTFQASTGGPLDLAFKLTTVTSNPPPPVPCTGTNDVVKYVQPPQLFNGFDVWNSSAFPPGVTDGPWVLADDFVCTNPGLITDIHIWGSWLSNAIATNSVTFWVAMFSNVPANPPAIPYSQPGALFWQQCFAPGQYVESFFTNGQESFMDPGPPKNIGPDSQVWSYCFAPSNPPMQSGTTANPQIYWLAVYAQQPAPVGNVVTNFFGWKTTPNYTNDISVHAQWTAGFCPTNLAGTGPGWTPTFDPVLGAPLDLAFALTTRTNPCTGGPTLIISNMVVECGTSWSPIPPTVLDPCCTPPPAPVLVQSITNTTSFCPQYITNIWAATDCLGVSATNYQVVKVVDTTPPFFTFCPASFTVPCGTAWLFGTPVASDNCCFQGIISSTVTNGTPCSQMITRTWLATDCCGNSNSCTQTVTVVATNPPIMSCAPNKSVPVGSSWSFDPPTATDACSGASLPVTVIGTVTNGTSPCGETFTQTWQAVDACHNTNFCSQTVTNVCPPVFCVESDKEKYFQGPNIFGGYDVWNTPYVLADDFICTNRGPVSDIHLWGSWLSDNPLTNTINFWLGIYDDVPAVTNGPNLTPSHPGTNLLWQQWFYHGQYAETIWTSNAQEQFLNPGNSNVIGPDSVVWYFCFYPTNAFQQQGTASNHITYWLAAYAQLPGSGNQLYGWKTTTNVLHDTSVHAVWPGVPPISNPGWTPTAFQPPTGGPAVPLDLAFKITECGPLRIKWVAPTNVVVSWDGGGHLQSATNVIGPYIDIPGPPVSPFTDYSVTPTNKFYRLRCYP